MERPTLNFSDVNMSLKITHLGSKHGFVEKFVAGALFVHTNSL